MKVSELEGAALDYWVAKADGWFEKNEIPESEVSLLMWLELGGCGISPSTQWEDGGPIIDRERIMLAQAPPCAVSWHRSTVTRCLTHELQTHRRQEETRLSLHRAPETPSGRWAQEPEGGAE